MTEASETLESMIAENRVIRGNWVGTDAQGRETACLLAAISVDVRKNLSPRHCPADIMPPWLAHLTPFIDDRGSLEAWPGVIRRYAKLAARWHVLTPEAWQRAEWRCKRASVIEAKSHTKNVRSVLVCDKVIALLDRAINGTTPPTEEWEAARKEAAKWEAAKWAAAEAAKWAAKWAAEEAKWAAAAAEAAAAEAAAEAAKWAAAAAAEAAKWEEAKWEAAEAAKWAAAEAAVDRMITAWFEILEDEITQAELSP
jgi:hypothetical protein